MRSNEKPSHARGFYEWFLASSGRAAFIEGLINSNPLTFETESGEKSMAVFAPVVRSGMTSCEPGPSTRSVHSRRMGGFTSTSTS